LNPALPLFRVYLKLLAVVVISFIQISLIDPPDEMAGDARKY